MKNIKAELVEMMNQALQLEHAARIQYLAHAEQVTGLNAEPLIGRLKEIAGDEAKHEEKFRNLIANYLGGVPSMKIAVTHPAKGIKSILTINLKDEKTALDFYRTILKKIIENKNSFTYEFETLEHEVRHIIIEEQEHISELKTLIG